VVEQLRKNKRTKKERRKKRQGSVDGCRAEFDYTGWKAYNDWRREVRAIQPSQSWSLDEGERIAEPRYWQPSSRRKRQGVTDRGAKDCWRDCDYPSQCLNEGAKERTWRVHRARMRNLEEEWARERAHIQNSIEVGSASSSSFSDDGDVEMDDGDAVDAMRFYDAEDCSTSKNANKHRHRDGDANAELCGMVAEDTEEEEKIEGRI
jgi:hypothetical protein